MAASIWIFRLFDSFFSPHSLCGLYLWYFWFCNAIRTKVKEKLVWNREETQKKNTIHLLIWFDWLYFIQSVWSHLLFLQIAQTKMVVNRCPRQMLIFNYFLSLFPISTCSYVLFNGPSVVWFQFLLFSFLYHKMTRRSWSERPLLLHHVAIFHIFFFDKTMLSILLSTFQCQNIRQAKIWRRILWSKIYGIFHSFGIPFMLFYDVSRRTKALQLGRIFFCRLKRK